jgi:histidinol-phosphatase
MEAMLNPEWRSRYDVAVEAAEKAGQLAFRYFDSAINVEWKSNQTPVTVADREAEQLLRETLLGRFRGDGFLGEESGEQPGESGFRWIIDPIDGTRSFVRGIPIWGTLVGLEYRGEQIAGVACVPALRQTFRALRGDGAYRDQRRIRVSDVGRLEESQVFHSLLTWFMKSGVKDGFLNLVGRTQRQRGIGDFYGFLLVAQGSGELMVDYGVSPWDVAALKPIIEEAGGRFTDWDGKPTIHRPDTLASNGRLHDEALALIKAGYAPGFDPRIVEHRKHIT